MTSADPRAPLVTGDTVATHVKHLHALPSHVKPLDALPPADHERLRNHFGSDAAADAALASMDLQALESAGCSARKAVELVRRAHRLDERESFFATAPSRKLRDEILEAVSGFAATAYGRNRLQLMAPHPDPESAADAAAHVMANKAMVAQLDRDRVRRLLRRIHRPREPSPRPVADRVVLCEDDAIEARWRKAGLAAWCTVSSRRDLARAAEAELAIALYDSGFDLGDLESVVEVPASAGLAEVCPEAVLAWFQSNREMIASAAELATLLGRPHKSGEALQLLEEADRRTMAPRELRGEVEEIRKELDQRLRERVQSLQLSGVELLETLGQRLPPPLQKAMTEVLAEGRDTLQARTGHLFQPFCAGFPIGVDEEELERMEGKLAGLSQSQRFTNLVRAAKRLAGLRPAVEAELASWLSFDSEFALGCFALHHDLSPAAFGERLGFRDSVHLSLAADGKAQRIAYEVGGDIRVALLTGANSGGKTTLLEHMGQLVIMARLGLPVVGAATVPWVEEIHYVTARRSLDAGAFETFLRSFLPVAVGTRPRLVLADEVEAVTEMEAAGRILGFFLDRLAAGNSLAVVVSHMAPHILAHCTASARIRVDGIEASGLDEGFRLVVERQPRLGHLARSTPELIVARLAATASGRDRDLFRDLLATFPAPIVPASVPAPVAGSPRKTSKRLAVSHAS